MNMYCHTAKLSLLLVLYLILTFPNFTSQLMSTIAPFMQNFQKWSNVLQKSCGVNTARFDKNVWAFFNIMQEMVNSVIWDFKLYRSISILWNHKGAISKILTNSWTQGSIVLEKRIFLKFTKMKPKAYHFQAFHFAISKK